MATYSPVVKLLRELIAIPSVNPTGDPGTTQINEQGMADCLAQLLKKMGASVTIQKIAPQRPNILSTWKPRGKIKAHILFAPHTDTVSVLGMTVAPFDPVIKAGRLYGRGATDTKGPMAAMLIALQSWLDSGDWKSAGVQVTFVGLMGEEAGNEGAIALAKSGFKANFQGVNAIYPIARAITVIEQEILPLLKTRPHPALGTATMSVGTIQGGSKVNIVPDHCRVEVDIRTVPTCDQAYLLPLVKARLAKMAPGVEVKLQRSSPALDNDPQNPWIEKLARAGRGKAVAPWFCDAAVFARAGMPAVAFGPGSIRQAHTRDEFISIKELEKGVKAYGAFLRTLS
jgi:acetylornithine deacetylase/succinyl-diaminopimelate desuccinylase-like protein